MRRTEVHSLEKRRLIKAESLDPANYLQSLINEGHQAGLITDAELERFQLQSMQLLAKRLERYTSGDSSSVREETAQSVFASMLFTVGVSLKSFPDIDMALDALRQEPLAELHKHGLVLVKEQVKRAKELYAAVKNDCLETENIAYNDTIQNAIPGFFTAYDAEFTAHDTPASIDYPLSNDKMDLVGIEYITGYLRKLSLENLFCSYFAEPDITWLLRSYDANHRDLLINIFSIVLANALGCAMANKDPIKLWLEPLDIQYLQGRFEGWSRHQLDQELVEELDSLFVELAIADERLKKHIAAATKELSVRIKNALEKKQLETVFICSKVEQPLTVRFEEGERLDDEVFRQIVNEIKECRYVSDKIAIIKRDIHSITDLADMLEGYCLFDDEFVEVFQALGDMELALLYKRLPTHVVDPSHHYTENEKEWHSWLRRYLEETDVSRGVGVKALAESIIW